MLNVIKSSGVTQEFTPEKLIQVLTWSSENTNIDPYELYEAVMPHIRDGMTTKEIQTVAIKVAAGMISRDEPDYQYVASNLAQFALRKTVYGQFEPISFIDHISKNVNSGFYDKEILQKYSAEEITYLESMIDHNRDFTFSYAGTMQLKEKYLVQDRSTKEVKETPQFAYMLIGMCLHQDEPQNRLKHVIRFYNAVSNKQISLPTPIMAGVRTPTRQFSSCVVIESGDSLDSINETNASIIKYISKRAGIGVNAGMIRAMGSKIGHGEVRHTGVIPFFKTILASVKSCSQGGVRGGAATLYYPLWHLELEQLIVLKNNKGVEENRIRGLDYGVQINNLMLERYSKDDYITLFSPNVYSGALYDAYFRDPDLFRELYEKAEKDESVNKKRIKARTVFEELFAPERANTGRIYPAFIDNMNDYGSFERSVAPIKQSNLCMEIALPTSDVGKEDGEIALCTLSAWVLGNFDIQDMDLIEELAEVQVRALDNLLDYQDYPVAKALKAKKRRALGVGVTNYAAFLASQFASYNDSNDIAHETFEKLQYALVKASVKLAKEKGPCEYYKDTKYGQGKLPIDWYNKRLDQLAEPRYTCDWEALRADLIQYGIRNSTLSALMPCESSSQVSNSTNGMEPPRLAVTAKESKEGTFNQVVPDIEHNGDLYDYAWQLAKTGNKGYLNNILLALKFTDQAASTNTYYDPENHEKGKVPVSVMIDDMLYYWYFGGKTLYYQNTRDGADGSEESGSDCESCKL